VNGPDAPALIPLAVMVATLREPIEIGRGPVGRRIIYEVDQITVKGERIEANLAGIAAADWMTIDDDGVLSLDVRFALRTTDGAAIFVQYNGRMANGSSPVITAPRFETGDSRYRWLNAVQAVAKGRFQDRTLTYAIYEVR